MVTISAFYALVGLLQAAASLSLPPRADPGTDQLLPKLKSDFKKGDTPSLLAQGYPKIWGSEDFRLQFDTPYSGDNFGAGVTEDEKYLVMFNGTHATFVDLDTNTTVTTFSIGVPSNLVAFRFTVRSIPGGGYDLYTSGGKWKNDYITQIFRNRLGSDLKQIGDMITYPGEIGGFDQNRRMATKSGDIFDLNGSNIAKVTLKNPGRITDMSFSGDGQYLSTVSWMDMTADLWNAATGEKIFQYAPTNAQNWMTKVSPDNKYAVISLGTGYVQVYTLANLTAGPVTLSGFHDWIRSIEWSPDGKYLATGDYGSMQIWKFPEAERVQMWAVDDSYGGSLHEEEGLTWLDSGNKVAWGFHGGAFVYDLEKNMKWWWTLGFTDHSWGGFGVYYLKKKGYLVSVDGDSVVRFWKV